MELRPVRVRLEKASSYMMNGELVQRKAKYAKGLFHCWEHYKDENFSGVWAIVELEDGFIKQFEVDEIQFTDKDPTKNIAL
jgi:hypothetical protein